MAAILGQDLLSLRGYPVDLLDFLGLIVVTV